MPKVKILNQNNMKCLVTGGAGFIGSHIVERLLKDNVEVVVVDNESAISNDEFHWYASANNHKVDIRDYDKIRPLFDGVDCVFHLAAFSRIQIAMKNPDACIDVNYVGTNNLLKCSVEAGVKRFVNSSTSSSYGLANIPPLREDMPTDCLNPYSASKVGAEILCQMYQKLHGLSTVTLRYFNVYGLRQPLKGHYAPVIGLFEEQKKARKPCTIVGDGEQRRDFTHVLDVVEANMCAMQTNHNGVFNIGTGKNHSVNDIAKLVNNPYNTIQIPSRPGEARITLADNTKAKTLLGWEPKKELHEYFENSSKISWR